MVNSVRPSPRCEVALLVDAETGEFARDGVFRVEAGSVEAQVLRALRRQYSSVVVMPFEVDGRATMAGLRALNPRMVFNLTEWIDGDRSRDHVITAMLDNAGLPYTGTTGAGLRVSRDKVLAKKKVAALGIATPRHFAAGAGFLPAALPYPLFVKPRHGDGSDAIGAAALVRNAAALRKRLRVHAASSGGAVLCEEYVAGRDLFVALLGNRPDVLHPLELVVGRQGRGAPRFATGRLKHDEAYQRRWQVSYRKARLPAGILREIRRSSRRIFHALELRDYARIDYRLTPDNRLVFIEANPNPDLGRHTFGRNLCFAGVRHEDLIRRIVVAARGRYRNRVISR